MMYCWGTMAASWRMGKLAQVRSCDVHELLHKICLGSGFSQIDLLLLVRCAILIRTCQVVYREDLHSVQHGARCNWHDASCVG